MKYGLEIAFWIVVLAGLGLALRPLINRMDRSK